MGAEELFLFLQQPSIAVSICSVAVLAIALLRRKLKTAAASVIVLLALHLYWRFGNAPASTADLGATAFYAILLVGFFTVAVREQAWTVVYVALLPLINWSFAAVPTFPIPEGLGGGMFQPLAIVTGLVLVVRDFAQRELRHWIWGAMGVGLVLSTLTSALEVVAASGLAFLVSETVDWAVYTFTKRPLSQRIMLSSLASAPLDQVAFIGLASLAVPGIFAWGTVLTGIFSKLIGAWAVSQVVAARERRDDRWEMNLG